MDEFKIEIFEKVTNGTLSVNDIFRELLILYGIRERYFYHYSYRTFNGYVITNELIECVEKDYIKMMLNKKDFNNHKPVKYMSDNIPTNKKLHSILYIR